MLDWRFPSNQNGVINGINDSGIETFADDSYYSLVRETIQNSLDVHDKTSPYPVIVEFDEKRVKTDSIPGIDKLSDVMSKCLNSNKDEAAAKRFFNNAKKVLSSPEISFLRVSDYNTRGLEGSDTCEKGTLWSRLIKENGSNNKEDTSGGSKGIGKNAAFACSSIRTVFYSSLDIHGLKSSFGVAKLVSYLNEDGQWTQGTGFFSDDESFTAIHQLMELGENRRTVSGTDIYIIGNSPVQNLSKKIEESVLLDFFISILNGKLIVRIQGSEISKENLSEYMSKINAAESEQKRDLLTYYHILTGNDPEIIKIPLDIEEYGKSYGFENGDCTLYIYAGKDNLNHRILMTREAGMRLFEQTHISGSINFTGILHITGKNMNKVFREMEVPSHDSWKPTRNNNPLEYEDIYRELRDWIREKVKEHFGKSSSDSIDAFGVEDFLPDIIDTGEDKELEGKAASLNSKLGTPKRMKASSKRNTIKEQIRFNDVADGFGTGGGGVTPPGPNPTDPPNPIPNPGPLPGPDPYPVPIPTEDGKNIKDTFKQVEVANSRLICLDAQNGLYRYSFIAPGNAKKSRLEFFLSGEQSEFPLKIKKVSCINSDTDVSCTENGKVLIDSIKKGSFIQLDLEADFNNYCMMEIDYYESKK